MNTERFIKGNEILAKFMGINYKCSSPELDYHHKQVFNEDGTPKLELGVTHWTFWYPHSDWNDLMAIVMKINSTQSNGLVGRDLIYTMQYLLGGGYLDDSINNYPKLPLTFENLWVRCVVFCDWYNKNCNL